MYTACVMVYFELMDVVRFILNMPRLHTAVSLVGKKGCSKSSISIYLILHDAR